MDKIRIFYEGTVNVHVREASAPFRTKGSPLRLGDRRGVLEKRKERGRILKMSGVFLPDTMIVPDLAGKVLSKLKRNYEKIMNSWNYLRRPL